MPFQPPAEKKILRNLLLALVSLCLTLLVGMGLGTMAFQGYFDKDQGKSAAGTPVAVAVETIVDGKDSETGLIAADGYLTVKQNCTGCHSSKLITQNHLSRERWEQTIRWMQKNQNLAQLGENEPVILDYLATYYGPLATGRRKALEPQKWYRLE